MILKLYCSNIEKSKKIMQLLLYYNISYKSLDIPKENGDTASICIIIDDIKSIKSNDNYIIINDNNMLLYILKKDIDTLYIETK